MKLGYSEFSYGYAFTENLVRSSASAPRGAPRFPSLIEEGRLGYDVRIDLPAVPFFFQFKLPELMVRSTAFEVMSTNGALQVPFFRMPIMRRDLSDQHALLMGLESSYPRQVFYAAPRMRNLSAFNEGYNACETHLRSVLVEPGAIGDLPDDSSHTFAYGLAGHTGWFCSEPREIGLRDFWAVTDGTSLKLDSAPPLRALAAELVERLSAVRPSRREPAGDEPSASGSSRPSRAVAASVDQASVALDAANIRQRFRALRRAAIAEPVEPDEPEVAENLYLAREIARIGLGVQLLIAQPQSESPRISQPG